MPPTAYEPEVFPTRWLPAGTRLTTWDEIGPYYDALRAREIESADGLVEWLRDLDELNVAVGQEGAERYIAMTCQTKDAESEAAYLEFVRDIDPRQKPVLNALREKYLDSPFRKELPADRYRVFDRSLENERALYREANVARETALAELEQQYQKVIGGLTVTFRGEEYTPARIAPILEETDREVREAVWRLVAARRLEERETIDGLFDRMVALRTEIAREAGFETYVGYAYKLRQRFDYGEAETGEFRDAIASVVVPLVDRIQADRRARLGLDALRPWDLSVDPLGRPPLRPFEEVGQLADRTAEIFDLVDPELGAQFRFMQRRGLLDLANRPGKAPGGYQETLRRDRLPFIFMNAVGLDGDLRTLLHEGGHAFHAFASRGESVAAYRDAPIEFCEVASMAMELLGARDTGAFYRPEEARRSYRQLLEGVVLTLPWIATVDGFQHWVYANPGHSRGERRAAWTALTDRFGGPTDWSGLDAERANLWHRQLHIFLYPFYYVEYGIAQLGALGVWRRSLVDRAGAVAAYRQALGLGGSRPLPELFEAAGVPFAFRKETLAPLMDALAAELESLGD